MTVLHAILTHRRPDDVEKHLTTLQASLPDSTFAVCYGGPRANFDDVRCARKVFLAEPSLRGSRAAQSYASVLCDIFEVLIRPEPEITVLHLIEFDHVIVHPNYERELIRTLNETGADWLGRHCVDRTHTNWWHTLRVQHDPELLDFLCDVSGNPERSQIRIFGGIANAFTVTRAAIERFVDMERQLERYCEMYLPTVMHHLGLRVRDANRVSTIFDHLRVNPPYSTQDIARLEPGTVYAIHPVKDYEHVLPAALSLVPKPSTSQMS